MSDHDKLIAAVNEGHLRVDAVQQFDVTCLPRWYERRKAWECECKACEEARKSWIAS